MGRARRNIKRVPLEGQEDDALTRERCRVADKEYRRLLIEAGYIKG